MNTYILQLYCIMLKCTHMVTCKSSHDFKQQLQGVGLRSTPRRVRVLEALHKHGKMSADEIAALPEAHEMDRVTVYRILKQLHEKGLVYEAHATHAGTHYQLTDHHTHMLTCTSCGYSEELPECHLSHTVPVAQTRRFPRVHAHALTFFGTCTRCARS